MRVHSTKLWLSCVLTLSVAACATDDVTRDVADPDKADVSEVEQDYSAAECSSATADSTITVFGTLYDVTDNSPSTYGKPTAVKSYIWDVIKGEVGAGTLDTGVFLVPSASGFPSSKYDTAAECTAVTLKRRLYHRGQLISATSVSGVWDATFGCNLPRVIGPYITNPPYEWFSNAFPVRVCTSATDSNGDVIPLRLWARALRLPTFEAFVKPEVKIGSSWKRVRNDATSADAYCIGRGHSTRVSSSDGSCDFAWAYWNTAFHTFQAHVPVVGERCERTISTIVCDN